MMRGQVAARLLPLLAFACLFAGCGFHLRSYNMNSVVSTAHVTATRSNFATESLRRGLAIPRDRPGWILGRAPALVIHGTEIELRFGDTLPGRLAKPASGLVVIVGDDLIGGINRAHHDLRSIVALFGSL